MGGSAAGRLSGGTTLGAGLGAQTHSHGGSTMDGPSSLNLAANGLDFNAANICIPMRCTSRAILTCSLPSFFTTSSRDMTATETDE